MTLIIIQDLKIRKKSTETKTKRFQYDLEIQNKKGNFRDFRFFDFALYPRSKYPKSRKFSFNSNFDSLKFKDALWFKKRKLKLPSF